MISLSRKLLDCVKLNVRYLSVVKKPTHEPDAGTSKNLQFRKIYELDSIRNFSTISRLKIYSGVAAVIGIPSTFALEMAQIPGIEGVVVPMILMGNSTLIFVMRK